MHQILQQWWWVEYVCIIVAEVVWYLWILDQRCRYIDVIGGVHNIPETLLTHGNEIQNLEDTVDREGAQPLKIFGKKAGEIPFPSNYPTESDVSPVSEIR